MDPTRTPDEIRSALVHSLRALRRVGDSREQRTALFRDIAACLVEVRAHFEDKTARQPDWKGRTRDYKEWVRESYAKAQYTHDEMTATQNAVRYHVSAHLRERLPRAQLESLGLRAEPIAERVREFRSAQGAELKALRGQDSNPDVARALAGALVVLQRVTPESVAELQGTARTQARAVLARLARRASELRAVADAEE
ncbi:hypothetical protein GA0070616_4597 [Micromonospora nigra]|uniref:Uncharacterized protein n=1 Tax=Micromonospora nigra TaxID=145857 RepID=A0A1C6SU98_9ACTN|nr:hypothetical protein [Micromonospora nigra]SCL32949.1 hypothetical protein GA0070616_4597 [Micromonospora nigra]